MDLSHLKVLVTGGGGSGVGAGICQALDKFGATLVINEKHFELAAEAAAKYRHAIPVQADISKDAEVAAMFTVIQEQIGPVNGLVNNAGIGLSKLIQETEEADFDRLMGVNLKGMWQVSKYFVKQLLANQLQGNIVNVSSVHAAASQPKYTVYAASKSAVEGFTRALAYELGQYRIRCNAIAPGLVYSQQNYDLMKTWSSDPAQLVRDFIEDQQILHYDIEAVDCGNTVAFLLSDLSRSITGQTIYVDAGKTAMLFNQTYVNNG